MSIFDDNGLPGPFDRLFGRPSSGLGNPHKFDFDVFGNVRANGASTGTRIDIAGNIRDEFGNSTGYVARQTGLGSWCRDIVPLHDPFKR